MTEYRYILQPYKAGMNTRYVCPSCAQRDKTFVRYIDTQTGEHLAPSVGRCNREVTCGYHYTPKRYFQDNKHFNAKNEFNDQYARTRVRARDIFIKPQPKPPVSLIPFEVFKASLNPTAFETNHFVQLLINLFGIEVASQLVSRYFIATSKYWSGATVFWQIAEDGIRTGKIMLYNPTTGKRVKEKINWVHSVLKIEKFNLKQCFFGEHLLNLPENKNKPIAIFEAAKTATIVSVYFSKMVCISCEGLQGLTPEKCKVLQGQSVTLFPDLNGFEKWSAKAKEISRLFPGTRFQVSDLLERKASEAERQQGLDLADYLIRFDYRAFQQQEQPEPPPNEIKQPQPKEIAEMQQLHTVEESYFTNPETPVDSEAELPKPESWEQDIVELETYFANIELPTEPIKLNPCSTITNVSLLIESHFATVKANNGNQTFLPYLHRLQELKQVLTTNLN